MAARLRDLEARHGARLGVFARNLRTGRSVRHRADERFPVCSLFKPLAVAAVLRDLPPGTPDRRLHWTSADVVENSPVTKDHVADGMTIAELSAAAVQRSDNTAGNLLLRELGGPAAITRFARSVGDRVTRLDRWEPDLNSAEPDRVTDTTTPYAIGRTYARLVLGDALARADRRRLTDWMLGTVTSADRFRAGLPRPGRSPTRPAAAGTAPTTTPASPGPRTAPPSSSRSSSSSRTAGRPTTAN